LAGTGLTAIGQIAGSGLSREAAMRDTSGARLTHDEIMRILGPIDDAKASAILAAGASLQDLEEAAQWVAGESDVMGELERPLTGVAAEVYDILTVDEPPAEAER
jgi:hypothetical protein